MSERWVSLAVAPDQLTAELWLALLREQGIPAMLDPGDVASYLGIAPTPVRVLVPNALLEAGQRLLEGPEEAELGEAPTNGSAEEQP